MWWKEKQKNNKKDLIITVPVKVLWNIPGRRLASTDNSQSRVAAHNFACCPLMFDHMTVKEKTTCQH